MRKGGLLNGLGSRFANTWRGVSLSERPSYYVRGEENGIFALYLIFLFSYNEGRADAME